jgi:hypothetical protein
MAFVTVLVTHSEGLGDLGRAQSQAKQLKGLGPDPLIDRGRSGLGEGDLKRQLGSGSNSLRSGPLC